MATRKTNKKKTGRRSSSREALAETLDRLERDLPPNFARALQQIRRRLVEFEKQIEKGRADRERRWNRAETQLRRDLARLIGRLEKAVEPRPAVRKKKAAAKKKASKAAARKKTDEDTALGEVARRS